MKRNVLVLLIFFVLYGCQKHDIVKNVLVPTITVYEAKTIFSKTLSRALQNEPKLRESIKAEALKRFDKDYDVLYYLIKDNVLGDGETVAQKLEKYADEAANFSKMVEDHPLLTIYIPELPKFRAENWNTHDEVPMVAVAPDKKHKLVVLINKDGDQLELPYYSVPVDPVVVVKENERVVLDSEQTQRLSRGWLAKSDFPELFAEKNGKLFMFIGPDFNGSKIENQQQMRLVNSASLDAELLTAYNDPGIEWHRDYIYYNISPATPNGVFRNNFSEFVRSFMLLNPNDFYLISDHANDPSVLDFTARVPDHPPMWTEGAFEFRMSVLLKAKNAVGDQLNKVFTVPSQSLVVPIYSVERYLPWLNIWVYTVTGFNGQAFYPNNLELIPWDLEQYGTAWKFVVSEYDPAEELTRTISTSTTYASNFGIDLSTGEKTKFGAKFGATSTITETTSVTYKTTTGSEDLGEGVLDFRTPVVLGPTIFNLYSTYEVTTGILSFAVEPKRIY